MDILEIINRIITLLGDRYKVINSYNNEQEIVLNGVVAVTATNLDRLHHGSTKDSKITIQISGQTLTDQDVTQKEINKMFAYIDSLINLDTIKQTVQGCAGVLYNTAQITSDGETNNFVIQLDLFVCVD